MSISIITEQELAHCGVSSLPLTPTASPALGGRDYTPGEVKAAFDRLPRLIAARLNALLSAVSDGTLLTDIPVAFGDATLSLTQLLELLGEHLENSSEPDSVPTSGSENAVTSGGVYAALLAQHEEILAAAASIASSAISAQELSYDAETGTLSLAQSAGGEAVDTTLLPIPTIQKTLALLRTLLGASVLYEAVEDNYSSRITAGGLPVVDNAPTTVHRITGDSVSSINIVPIQEMDTTVYGVHIVGEAESGTVRINGKPEGSHGQARVSEDFYLTEGTYTIYTPNRTMRFAGWTVKNQSGKAVGKIDWAELGGVVSGIFTVAEAGYHYLHFFCPSGYDYPAFEDYLETPMILRGDVTASLPTFAPYYPWLRNAAFSHITSTGRNLITSLRSNGFTTAGVTFAFDVDNGTITVNGTTNGNPYGTVTNSFYLPKGTYTLYVPNRIQYTEWQIRNASNTKIYSIDWTADANVKAKTFTITEPGYHTIYVFISSIASTIDNYVETPMVIPGAVTENFPDFEMYREDASFALASPVTLRKWDYIDVDAQELVIGTEEIWKADGEPDFTDEELATYPLGSVISADRRVLAYPVETPTTEPITLPKTYKAWDGGCEYITADTAGGQNTDEVPLTAMQDYYIKVGGEHA